jgi:hypothetical protein
LTWKPLHFLSDIRRQRFDQQPFGAIVISQSFLLFSHISVKNLAVRPTFQGVILEALDLYNRFH